MSPKNINEHNSELLGVLLIADIMDLVIEHKEEVVSSYFEIDG
jgi:hypothetical protein